MEKIGQYEFDTITEEDVLSEQLRKAMKKHEENARVTRVMLPAAVIAVGAEYFLPILFFKDLQGVFYLTKGGMFLGLMAIICFTVFVIFSIKQHKIYMNQWICPHCGQKFPYYLGLTIYGTRRFGNKDVLDDCYNRGIFLGKKEDLPFIVPGRCPNCRDRITKVI